MPISKHFWEMEKQDKIRYVWHGVLRLFFYSFEEAYEFNYGKNKEEKVKVVDSCYKKRW